MKNGGITTKSIMLAAGMALSTSAFAQTHTGVPLPADPTINQVLRSIYPDGNIPWLSTASPIAAAAAGVDQSVGPDVIVGSLMNSSGLESTNETLNPAATVGNIRAYGIGTVSCNIGNVNLLWDDSSARKPIIAQNMYRLRDGRLEQIGASWLKHGFTALTQNLCGSCNGVGGWLLGVGCSDPYSASLNASQNNGPRYEVNPFTGRHMWPIATPRPAGDGTLRRMQVNTADLADWNNPAVIYFVEGQYITPDDHAFGINNPDPMLSIGSAENNASYRRVSVSSTGQILFSIANQSLRTQRTKPAIMAWADFNGPGGTPDPNVIISRVTQGSTYNPGTWNNSTLFNNVPVGGANYLPGAPTGDGILLIGSNVYDLGNGIWRYEYAVQNLTSNREAGSFSVPVPAGATITSVSIRQVPFHSGIAADDAVRNTPWASSVTSSEVRWFSTIAPPAINLVTPTAPVVSNGLQWGHLWNFSFVSNVPPVSTGQATIGFYRPALPGSPNENLNAVSGTAWTPDSNWTACYANCDLSTGTPALTPADFVCFLNKFRAGDNYANCDASTGTPALTPADFVCFLNKFRAGC